MIKTNNLLCIFGGQARINAYTRLTSFILTLRDGAAPLLRSKRSPELTPFILSLPALRSYKRSESVVGSKDGPRINLGTNVSQSTYSKPTSTSNLSFDELRMKGFWPKISVLGVHTLILLFLSLSPLAAKQDLAKLLEAQAANPTDPIVNYNLGVAQYLDKKYVTAAPNFIRAAEHGTSNKKLVQHAQFNVAKCLERGALATLPNNWKKKETDIEDKLLDTAITSMQQACTWYKKDTADIKMQKNLVLAEDLLKKLLAKKKQQEQQNKQDKDKNKDKNQQKNNKSGEQQDQQKDGQSGNQDKQSGGKSGGQDKQDQKSGNQSGAQDQVKDKSNNEHKDNKKAGGQKSSEAPPHPGEEGDDQQSDGKEAKNDQQQQQNGVDHAQDSGKEQTSSEGTQPDDKKQASLQDRRMQAVLENLQADESKQQKALLSKQLKQSGKQQAPTNNQKPW